MARSSGSVRLEWHDRELLKLTTRALAAGLREAGKFARKGIKAELSGRPGSPEGSPPGKVSGDLRRAVGYRTKTRTGKFVAMDVGAIRPNRADRKFPGETYAKALRLARGFVGRDRLGRVYSQRGRPFVDPFLARNERRIAEIVASTASTWLPKSKGR